MSIHSSKNSAIRTFLVEDGRYDWAFSGSMLGTELGGVTSFPVGYVHQLVLRPMDFEEFCWAIGVSDEALAQIREVAPQGKPIETYIHEAMLANFRTYLVVGGMPEVVQTFLDARGNLGEVRAAQTDLNSHYRYDISKYSGSRAPYVRSIFDQLPTQLEGASRKFVLNSIDPNARYQRYQRDFVWLVDAGVGLKTNLVREPKSPLARTASASQFKLYQSDVGMLMARYPQSLAQAAYFDEKSPNLGGIYENIVAQELVAAGFSLYYYQTKKRGEVDFVVDGADGCAWPIEVKSGRSFRAHASLDHVLACEEYGVQKGIVLSRGNGETDGHVLYLPIYAIFCLRELIDGPESDEFTLAVRSV